MEAITSLLGAVMLILAGVVLVLALVIVVLQEARYIVRLGQKLCGGSRRGGLADPDTADLGAG